MKLILGWVIGWVLLVCYGATFSLGSTKVCTPAILETYLSYQKGIWNAATNYFVYFYLNVLFPLTTILLLIYFTAL